MVFPLHVSLEAHPAATTLYLRGVLGDAAALRLSCLIHALPLDTVRLRVDMRGLALVDLGALEAVVAAVRRWARARRIEAHIAPPGSLAETVPRPVTVTRSLRFRARSETDPTETSPGRDGATSTTLAPPWRTLLPLLRCESRAPARR